MTIREMQLDDLEQVLPIEESNFSVPWTANGFFSFLIREDVHLLVAEENGQVLGYCGAILTPPESDITNICVRMDSRRRGIAVELFSKLKNDLLSKNITTIHLEVRESNQAALQLYKKLGFVQDGLRPRYYEVPVEDAVLMSWRYQ
ncbi:ribosomal protein S18-alanine N-acetyltransferase [Blautia liquoris]|uniref:[Ribosomal protein bS18]-alanine N-acetyltransferase n=1 Tax=Blautia liquoris TaxID=2779518 RepID=A0A7M2RKR0_9FIRM|nr:ribosomal protein S18-alanine N-acetyltransferase [Blautia liquoris]